MGKTACKKKKYEAEEGAKYVCKKCGAFVRREKYACKPQKLDKGFLVDVKSFM